ncbi:hypothetical protein IMZ48_18435 [Candidatus Bathyarchaeota archaeon]|nr:hypothetical protein [Candidatus Bathyarchaeota archaeon]
MPRRELPPETRAHILKLAAHLAPRQIAALYPEIPPSTIRTTLSRAASRGPAHASRPRTGRPRVLTAEQRDHVYDLLAHKNPEIRMRDLLEEVDFKVKARAMRLLVRELGFPTLLATRGR